MEAHRIRLLAPSERASVRPGTSTEPKARHSRLARIKTPVQHHAATDQSSEENIKKI